MRKPPGSLSRRADNVARRLAGGTALLLATLTLGQPAAADWRDEQGILRVGVVAELGPVYERTRMEGFRTFLEARIELPVELVTLADYDALVDAHASGGIDYAIHTAFSFSATVHRCGCIEPVAAPLAFDGSSGFHALLVARRGRVGSIDNTRDKRIAMTARDSVAGRLAPLLALERAGLDPEADVAIVEAADPIDALTMLFTGEADLAVAWGSMAGNEAAGYSFGALTDMVAAGTLDMNDVDVVWQSPEIRFGPHAVRTDAPNELKLLLLDSLMSLAREAPGILDSVDHSATGGGGFARAATEDYAYIDELAGSGDGG